MVLRIFLENFDLPMSRSDYINIGIIAVCLLALIFLVYKFVNLDSPKPPAGETAAGPSEEAYYPDPLPADPAYQYDPASDTLQGTSPSTESPSSTVQAETAPEPEISKNEGIEETVSSSTGDYLVLAGSFRQRANAEAVVRRLKNKGYAEAELSLFNRGAYATVLAGRFETYAEAQARVSALKKDGVDAYIQKKRTAQVPR